MPWEVPFFPFTREKEEKWRRFRFVKQFTKRFLLFFLADFQRHSHWREKKRGFLSLFCKRNKSGETFQYNKYTERGITKYVNYLTLFLVGGYTTALTHLYTLKVWRGATCEGLKTVFDCFPALFSFPGFCKERHEHLYNMYTKRPSYRWNRVVHCPRFLCVSHLKLPFMKWGCTILLHDKTIWDFF